MTQMLEAAAFMWINAYYFLWMYTLKYSLPKSTSQMLENTLKGNIATAKDYLLKELAKEVEKIGLDEEPAGEVKNAE